MSDPKSAWNRLRAGNDLCYVVGARRKPTVERPTAAVFRCADAAVDSATVFGQSWDSLVDVSTWGHVVDSGVLATMEYAVEALEVPLIVVLGHDQCQAVRAAMRAWDEAVIPDGAMRSAVQQNLSALVRRGRGADSISAVTAAHVVETGLALLERSPIISRRVDQGRCGIICATTDSDDCRLRAYATIGPLGDVPDSMLELV